MRFKKRSHLYHIKGQGEAESAKITYEGSYTKQQIFSVHMEAFDELLSINVPWSQEFSGGLRICT